MRINNFFILLQYNLSVLFLFYLRVFMAHLNNSIENTTKPLLSVFGMCILENEETGSISVTIFLEISRLAKSARSAHVIKEQPSPMSFDRQRVK